MFSFNATKYQYIWFLAALLLTLSMNSYSQEWQGHLAKGGEVIDIDSLVAEISNVDVFLFGEQHEVEDIVKLQHAILHSLVSKNIDFILSVEFLSVEQQDIVDSYLSNKISLADFKEETKLPEIYSVLFETAKNESLEIIAANASQISISCIYKKGIRYLDAQDDIVGKIILPTNDHYRDLIEKTLGNRHPHKKYIGNIVLAQAYKDAKMAYSISDNIENSNKLIFHISGRTHIEDNHGIYFYLKRKDKNLSIKSLVAFPKGLNIESALSNDFVYLSTERYKGIKHKVGSSINCS